MLITIMLNEIDDLNIHCRSTNTAFIFSRLLTFKRDTRTHFKESRIHDLILRIDILKEKSGAEKCIS